MTGCAAYSGEASGIGLATASVVVMPLLSWLERRTGRALGSASVVADSKQTLLCAWLSAVMLPDCCSTPPSGWGGAGPTTALVTVVAIREGAKPSAATPVLEVSSGDRQRHRVNRGGQRQVNKILHTAAMS